MSRIGERNGNVSEEDMKRVKGRVEISSVCAGLH
jgi:hypothetical protein